MSQAARKDGYQLTLPLSLNPSYCEADLYPAACQETAMRWIQDWPHNLAHFVVICGEPNSGKTHLAHVWQKKSNALMLRPSVVKESSPLYVAGFRDSFIIDGIDQWLCEGVITEEWLFHFYNLMKEKKGYLLFTANKVPAQWGISLPDLRSRLQTFLPLMIDFPDDETLKALLAKQLSEQGVLIDHDLLDYIVKRIERSFQKAANVVTLINQESLRLGQKLSVSFVRETLKNHSI